MTVISEGIFDQQKFYENSKKNLYREEYRKDFGKEWIAINRLTCVYDDGDFIILEKS